MVKAEQAGSNLPCGPHIAVAKHVFLYLFWVVLKNTSGDSIGPVTDRLTD